MKMKKIVVMSDSHGYHQMINRVKELEPDGDYYVCLLYTSDAADE